MRSGPAARIHLAALARWKNYDRMLDINEKLQGAKVNRGVHCSQTEELLLRDAR
jgi:hypothetical protein